MNVNGMCIGEETDGVVSYYGTDALGSVTHVLDASFTVMKTMRYKPYGEVLARSGTTRDSVMQWVGSYGYRATSFPASSHYVRHNFTDKPGLRVQWFDHFIVYQCHPGTICLSCP
jgi:hypothetical protein